MSLPSAFKQPVAPSICRGRIGTRRVTSRLPHRCWDSTNLCRSAAGGSRWRFGSAGSLEGADDGGAFDRLEAGEVGQPGGEVGVELACVAEDRAGGEVGGAGGGAR